MYRLRTLIDSSSHTTSAATYNDRLRRDGTPVPRRCVRSSIWMDPKNLKSRSVVINRSQPGNTTGDVLSRIARMHLHERYDLVAIVAGGNNQDRLLGTLDQQISRTVLDLSIICTLLTSNHLSPVVI